ncbi:hypothetical protein SNE40_011500 [Patella caerulea]|uniref:Uncharacterized protein n=1 Tax=Patella caerulea TaxID=87958 RepID=A0AAN8PLQ5_PATCE
MLYGLILSFSCRESAVKLDPKIRRGLFLFAVSNSCMDPIVYGMFTINFKREFSRCCYCVKTIPKEKVKKVNEINRVFSPRRSSLRNSGSSGTSQKNAERLYIRSQDNSGSYMRYTPMSESLTNSRFSLSSMTRENGQSCRANINNFVGIGCMGETI